MWFISFGITPIVVVFPVLFLLLSVIFFFPVNLVGAGLCLMFTAAVDSRLEFPAVSLFVSFEFGFTMTKYINILLVSRKKGKIGRRRKGGGTSNLEDGARRCQNNSWELSDPMCLYLDLNCPHTPRIRKPCAVTVRN